MFHTALNAKGKKMAVDLQAQLAFVNRLREGYVISTDEIKEYYNTEYPNRFANSVRIRTGLDIVKAKAFDPLNKGHEITVYFLASDVHPEVAGLDFMQNLEEAILGQDALESIEYQDGYYLMWVCRNYVHLSGDDVELCGQFHKVDLAEEPLLSPRTVRCVQCGKQYQVKPKGK